MKLVYVYDMSIVFCQPKTYFPEDFLLLIDESHMTIPQIRGMYLGDKARKENLVDFGFNNKTNLSIE